MTTSVEPGQPVVPSPPYDGPDSFRTALLDAGVLVATSVAGLYHRSGEFEDVLQGVERYAARQRTDATAPRRWFPPLLPRADLLRTDYLRSFPDLVGTIDVFTGDDVAHKALLAVLETAETDREGGEDGGWASHLTPAEVVLSSSICHNLYATLPQVVPADGLLAECSGFAFRHEPSGDPARMQSFRMYEFVLVGTPAQALAHRDAWAERGLAALRALGLPVRLEVANDPFFGRAGRMLTANQLASELKYEVVVDLTAVRPTAISSANYHEDHFGSPFALATPDGEVAHSACFGFGLERITLALFAVHGLDVTAWPGEVREALA